MKKIELMMKKEAHKRAKSKALRGFSDAFMFEDAKAEFIKMNKSMIEFRRALNSGNVEEIREFCYLNSCRLRLIYRFFR